MYYIGHLASAYPPFTNGFQISPRNICLPSFSVPGLWGDQTLSQLLWGLAFDPTWPIKAPHSPGHRDRLGTGMLPREGQSETLKKKSLFPEISAELLERGIFFPPAARTADILCHHNPKRNQRQRCKMRKSCVSLSNSLRLRAFGSIPVLCSYINQPIPFLWKPKKPHMGLKRNLTHEIGSVLTSAACQLCTDEAR